MALPYEDLPNLSPIAFNRTAGITAVSALRSAAAVLDAATTARARAAVTARQDFHGRHAEEFGRRLTFLAAQAAAIHGHLLALAGTIQAAADEVELANARIHQENKRRADVRSGRAPSGGA